MLGYLSGTLIGAAIGGLIVGAGWLADHRHHYHHDEDQSITGIIVGGVFAGLAVVLCTVLLGRKISNAIEIGFEGCAERSRYGSV
ncbi:MAG: hypothetical protein COV52_06410 [Gammaproteobacteria bacterium CG11_big_fil_rev_8_21_14_0_20_46_22]|nr:MAG: hypothetical protein COW05_07255 [Gammaproteobacteria bacterium CG12_big_fil_rev_8_21_14_0_65_46_12]PIR11131.1 MAG: hypothetical protein COV52_06410 [Gammaproteobacteria bacterium CG11_big_fil_rev_8_21_14_0_20_46_22]